MAKKRKRAASQGAVAVPPAHTALAAVIADSAAAAIADAGTRPSSQANALRLANSRTRSLVADMQGKSDELITLLADLRGLADGGTPLAIREQRQEIGTCLSDIVSICLQVAMLPPPASHLAMPAFRDLNRLTENIRELATTGIGSKIHSCLYEYFADLANSTAWPALAELVVNDPADDFAHIDTSPPRLNKQQKQEAGDVAKTRQRQQRENTERLLGSECSPRPGAVLRADNGWEEKQREQMVVKAKARRNKQDMEYLKHLKQKGLLSSADSAWLAGWR